MPNISVIIIFRSKLHFFSFFRKGFYSEFKVILKMFAMIQVVSMAVNSDRRRVNYSHTCKDYIYCHIISVRELDQANFMISTHIQYTIHII